MGRREREREREEAEQGACEDGGGKVEGKE